MTDVHDKATRSYNMSRIKGRDTKPEMLVRRFLHGKGLRYSLHNKKLAGKPDLTLTKYRTVIFINGCFWHGHVNCRYFILPKTRKEWWMQKIEETTKRDKASISALESTGWKTIILWECDLKKEKIASTLNNLFFSITGKQE